MIEEKMRCQSCGMPLIKAFCGSDADASLSEDYCKFCYRKGCFTEPLLTLQDMIKKSVSHMTSVLGMPEERAIELAQSILPGLKRWRGN